MEFNRPSQRQVGADHSLAGLRRQDRECAEDLLDRLWELMNEVGFPTRLDPEVVPEDDLPLLVEQCTQVVNYRLNMRRASPADLTHLYRRALGRE
jgi:alcohol dehydrogenase class IV